MDNKKDILPFAFESIEGFACLRSFLNYHLKPAFRNRIEYKLRFHDLGKALAALALESTPDEQNILGVVMQELDIPLVEGVFFIDQSERAVRVDEDVIIYDWYPFINGQSV